MHDDDDSVPPAMVIPEPDYKGLYENAMMRLTTVSRIAETIALGKNTGETWQRSLRDIVLLMHASVGSIYMLNDERTRLSCIYEYSSIAGTSVSIEEGIELELLEGLPIMEILRNGSGIRLDTISDELNERLNLHTKRKPYFYNSAICSPILIGASINGAISDTSSEPRFTTTNCSGCCARARNPWPRRSPPRTARGASNAGASLGNCTTISASV